jgi:hypothetical protein
LVGGWEAETTGGGGFCDCVCGRVNDAGTERKFGRIGNLGVFFRPTWLKPDSTMAKPDHKTAEKYLRG